MNRRTKDLERWLEAEAEDAPEAEERLAQLFSSLPARMPPVGFAERVLVRAGVASAPSTVERWRWAVAVLLATTALTLAGLVTFTLRTLEVLGVWTDGPTPLAWTFDAFGALVRGSVAVLSFLVHEVPRALRIAAAAAETPEVLAASSLAVIVAAAAFHLLQKTIERERSWSHVPTTS